MTKIKKVLAVILAFSMILGSVSIMASAIDQADVKTTWPSDYASFGSTSMNSFGVKTQFFDEDDNPITKAARGDTVYLRIWIISDFYSNSAQFVLSFPKDVFVVDYYQGDTITYNKTKGSFSNSNRPNGIATNISANYYNPGIEVDCVEAGYIDQDFLDTYDYAFLQVSMQKTVLWNDPVNWLCELELTVNEDLEDVDAVGKFFVDARLIKDKDHKAALSTMSKSVSEGANSGDEFSSWTSIPDATLVAEPITFSSKVIFDANGGTFAADAKTEIAGFINEDFDGTAPAIASAPVGKTFKGWSFDSAATTGSAIADLGITHGYEDVTVYAIYGDLEPVTLKFNSNSGTFAPGADTEVDEVPGKPVTAPEVTRYGYTFNGWSTDSNATEGNMTLTAPNEDTVYFATWKVGTYNAEFYVDGELYETVPTEFNQPIDAPEDPEESTGYTFSGWSPAVGNMTGEGLRFDGTLDPVDCPVTFNLNGGNIGGNTAEVKTTVEYDDVVTAPANIVKPGYTLSGWKNLAGEDVTFTDDYPVMKSLNGETYTAQWTPNTGVSYTVELNIMDTTGAYKTTTNTYENGVVGEPVPYTYTAPEGFTISAASENIDADIPETGTLVVKYFVDRNKHYVTVDNGIDAPYTVEYLYGATVADPESRDKAHETFDSWTWTADDNNITKPATMPDYDVKATATFKAKTYTVTWNLDGETETTSGTNEDAFEIPDVSEPYGYEFSGWFEDAEMTTEAEFPETFEESTTYYGTITAKEYTFNFFADVNNDGTDEEYATRVSTYDDIIQLPEAPKKTGYEFVYWTGDFFDIYDGDEMILENSDPEETQWPDEFDLYAIFDALEYDVIFNADIDDDGEAELYKTVPTYFDDEIDAPEDPQKEGYTFKGWLLDGEPVDFDDEENPVILTTEGATFEALFEINEYTVTFVDEDGKTVLGTDTVEHGSAATAPANPADKEDKFFTGWDKDFSKVTGDMTVTAVYGDNVVITFVADNEIVGEFSGKPGAPFEGTVPTPEKDGYTRAGWTPEFNNVYPQTTTRYTAVFEPKEYTINYVVDGKATDLKTTAKCDAPITLATYTPATGYTFNGWYTDAECTIPANITTMPAFGATLYGKTIGQEGIVVTVNFYYMDTTGAYSDEPTSTETKYGTAGKEYTATYTTPEGFILDEDESNISGIVKGDGSLELSVYFERNQYTLTTVVDGTTTTKKVYYEAAVSVVEPDIEGKDFTGWTWTETEGGAEIAAPATMPAKDITATAGFKTQSFTVTFVDWDGTVLKTETVEYGKAATAPAVPDNQEGHDFTGWSPADFSSVKSDLTITAVYGIQSFEVKFVDWDDTVLSTQNVDYGKAATAPADPDTKEGYSFKNWDKAYDSITADTTVKAVYEINSYDITYYVGTTAVYETQAEFGAEFPAYTIKESDIPEGYTFDKWVDEFGNDLPDTVPADDVVIVAKLNAIEYTATFNATEGEFEGGEKTKEFLVAYGTAINAPAAPTREGYIFAGWEPKVPATMPANDVTFDATWMEKPSTYYVTFVVDGETYDAYEVEVGKEIPLPADPEKFGYKFDGWDPEVPATMPEQNMTFTAKWRIDETLVTVVVGGTVIGAVTLGSIAAMNAAAITGVSIIGGIAVIWLASELIGDIERPEEFTVTYLVEGESYAEFVVAVGDDIPVPADPELDGATFIGWNPEVPEKMPANDLVFDAEFEYDENAGDNTGDTDDGADSDDNYAPEGEGNANPSVPATGSATTALAIAAGLSVAAAAAFISRKKKDEDAE